MPEAPAGDPFPAPSLWFGITYERRRRMIHALHRPDAAQRA